MLFVSSAGSCSWRSAVLHHLLFSVVNLQLPFPLCRPSPPTRSPSQRPAGSPAASRPRCPLGCVLLYLPALTPLISPPGVLAVRPASGSGSSGFSSRCSSRSRSTLVQALGRLPGPLRQPPMPCFSSTDKRLCNFGDLFVHKMKASTFVTEHEHRDAR